MGFLDKLLGNKDEKKLEAIRQELKMINGYTPAFKTHEGGLFELDLTRSIITNFARHCSKLKPECKGKNNTMLNRLLQNNPNPYMTTPVFLQTIAAIYETYNNVFLIPLYDPLDNINGVYPISPEICEVKEYDESLYLVYEINRKKRAIEYERVGVLSQHNYKDMFGENNAAMNTMLNVISTQNQGIIEAVKSSNFIRFLVKIAGQLKPKDLEAKKKTFTDSEVSSTNQTGVMMYDDTFSEVKQVDSKPYVVDKEQMESIKNTAYNYFGTNEKILQNNYSSDEWNAYYEGKIEPFAIQLSIVLTNMFFSKRAQGFDNSIILTANRLQYLSNNEKLQTVVQLFDRGFITHNMGLEVFNMASKEDGDKYYIRKEYEEYNDISLNHEIGGNENVQET